MAQWDDASWQAFLDSGGGYQYEAPPAWVPPSLYGHPPARAWQVRHADYVNLAYGVAWGITKIKGLQMVWKALGSYLWILPLVAWTSGLTTILLVERLVGKKEAAALSHWYALPFTDPYAWHVETDRVVQGAVHNVAADFSEGVRTSPAVVGEWGDSLYQYLWSSERAQAAWRKAGERL
jgi:hypothetical protein